MHILCDNYDYFWYTKGVWAFSRSQVSILRYFFATLQVEAIVGQCRHTVCCPSFIYNCSAAVDCGCLGLFISYYWPLLRNWKSGVTFDLQVWGVVSRYSCLNSSVAQNCTSRFESICGKYGQPTSWLAACLSTIYHLTVINRHVCC